MEVTAGAGGSSARCPRALRGTVSRLSGLADGVLSASPAASPQSCVRAAPKAPEQPPAQVGRPSPGARLDLAAARCRAGAAKLPGRVRQHTSASRSSRREGVRLRVCCVVFLWVLRCFSSLLAHLASACLRWCGAYLDPSAAWGFSPFPLPEFFGATLLPSSVCGHTVMGSKICHRSAVIITSSVHSYVDFQNPVQKLVCFTSRFSCHM